MLRMAESSTVCNLEHNYSGVRVRLRSHRDRNDFYSNWPGKS